MLKYEYKMIFDDHFEDLLVELNRLGKDGWRVVNTIQEHAFTKIILEKEQNV